MLGLATPFQTQNYGTKLQAFAMQNIFLELGYDVEIISYTYVSSKKEKIKNILSIKKLSSRIKQKRQKKSDFSNPCYAQCVRERNRDFDRFTNEYLPTTRNFVSLEELKKYSERYDAVICGSDQIWLPVHIQKGYYSLSFVPEGVKRIAYAPSIGIGKLEKSDQKMYRDFLCKMDSLSCREISGCEIIEQTANRKAQLVLDPTLLVSKSEWEKLSGSTTVIDGDYIFCYFLGENPQHRQKVKELAKLTGCKIVTLPHIDGYVEADLDYADYALSEIGPDKFINLIKNAKYVCTDSFHGSVFSTIFEKEFFVFERFSVGAENSTNTRLYSLLSILDLANRQVKDVDIATLDWAEKIKEKIDYNKVVINADKHRKSSFDYIKNALGDIKPSRQKHIEIIDKKDCCGCSACADVCPKNCIKMVADSEGFVYPEVDKLQCVNCSACIGVCPIKKFRKSNSDYTAFACRNNDDEIRRQSTSGGVFTPLAEEIIKTGGVVIGASFDKNFQVEHTCVEDVSELYKFRSSKYVQSNTEGIFNKTKDLLLQGRRVLFSGTPCQVYALKTYLKKDYDNLVTVDLFCYGVPSPKVWNKYLDFANPQGKNIESISFRDKRISWEDYSLTISYGDSETSKFWKEDAFARGFGFSVFNRPYCSVCRLKSFSRISDITLGDLWHIDRIFSEMNDHKGTSILCVNTDKGKALFDSIKSALTYREIDNQTLRNAYPVLGVPTKPHKNRGKFFEQLESEPFDTLSMKCATVDRTREFRIWRSNVLHKTGVLPLLRKIKNII